MGVSPSASDAVPEQVSIVDVTAVVGSRLAETSNTGVVLFTVSAAEEVTEAPFPSVSVATHVMSSVGVELLDERTRVSVVPRTLPVASCHS